MDNQRASDAGTERRADTSGSRRGPQRVCLPHAQASPGERCPERIPASRTRCEAHERAYQRWRPHRAKYDAAWAAHSRQRRSEHPWCMEQDRTCKGVLSVDHPTDDVLCMSHHDRREAARRAAAKRSS